MTRRSDAQIVADAKSLAGEIGLEVKLATFEREGSTYGAGWSDEEAYFTPCWSDEADAWRWIGRNEGQLRKMASERVLPSPRI